MLSVRSGSDLGLAANGKSDAVRYSIDRWVEWRLRAGSRRLANSSIIRILAIVIDASFDRWTGDLTHTGPIYEEGVNRVTLDIYL